MKFPLRKFLSYYKPYRPLFAAVLISALVASGITLVLPLLTRYITKTVLAVDTANALNEIYRVGLLMLLLVLVRTACDFFYDYRGHQLGAMMEGDLRQELFAHYQKLSFSFYDQQRTGQLMSRLTNDLLNLSEVYHHFPEDLIRNSIKFIGAFVILININTRLALLVFAFVPVMAVFTLYFNKRINIAITANKARIADVNAQVEDSLAGIRVVKSFANEEVEKEKFCRENRRFLLSRSSTYLNEAFVFQGLGMIVQLITITMVVFGGTSIVRGGLDLPDLITFLLYIGHLTEPIIHLSHMTVQLQEGIAGFQRFMEVLSLQPDVQDAKGALDITTVHGNVEFRNVSFKYEQNHDYVLKNISLTVKPGEYVAFVGSSGVGKTTLCSLIPRFYEATEGQVLLDGVDVRDLTLRSLRQNVGIVHQDVYLFAGTVLENILYGKPNASHAEVIEAAKQANAHEFIMQLPQGYQTDIGQRGVKLSGGQKQRLSIARVFLKNPPILIFDEATSSLDNESESVVQESLEALAKNRTTFVIAHRLSTIRKAQRIVVLTGQGIEEQGTHESLIALNGTYARLYNMHAV